MIDFTNAENESDHRKFARLTTIKNLRKHPNADTLEIATVLNWQVVVKQGEFKEGDSVIFFEIDAILPDVPLFEFLRNKQFTIRTMKLRGFVSQGMCVPASVIAASPQFPMFGYDDTILRFVKYNSIEDASKADIDIGTIVTPDDPHTEDLTKALGISKVVEDIPSELEHQVIGYMPHYIAKTDCDNIQSNPHLLQGILSREVAVTEKLNGQSVTMFVKDGQFGICSRRLQYKLDCNSSIVTEMLKYEDAFLKLTASHPYKDLAIQGELVGPGIAKNYYKLPKLQFFAFSLFDITSRSYDSFEALCSFAERLSIPVVPPVTVGFIEDGVVMSATTGQDIVDASNGPSFINPTRKREGIVITRVADAIAISNHVRIKAISPTFLVG